MNFWTPLIGPQKSTRRTSGLPQSDFSSQPVELLDPPNRTSRVNLTNLSS